MKKVMLGMSGGVDSSVAALLLKEQGYDVTGVTMKLRPDEYMKESISGGCCSIDDINDARRVCQKLNIPHFVLNFTDDFSKLVIDYFAQEYLKGKTPNPCIACNRYIKFEEMLRRAVSMDFDYIATGHYANIYFDKDKNRWLLKSAPTSKDQSYVLYSMTQYQLSKTLMPLGGMSKDTARQIAYDAGLPVAHKPDSQEICFVENKDYAGFIEKYSGIVAPTGDFVDTNGNIIGRHKGITHYTIGQRKGLGIAFGKPMYVNAINPEKNEIMLGEEGTQYRSELVATDLNLIAIDYPTQPMNVTAMVRYQAKLAHAILYPQENGDLLVKFEQPQRSITPGQAIVFYDGDIVLGGGTILNTFN